MCACSANKYDLEIEDCLGHKLEGPDPTVVVEVAGDLRKRLDHNASNFERKFSTSWRFHVDVWRVHGAMSIVTSGSEGDWIDLTHVNQSTNIPATDLAR
jgi:hypothetical protein